MAQRVAVVTDSTASLPPELVKRWGIAVVQMQLQIGDEVVDEAHVPTERVLQAMRENVPISVAPPHAGAFFWTYQDAWAHGADVIVSLHLSQQLSKATEAARDAAARVNIPVHIVDTQSSGMSLGFAALAAAQAASSGGNASQVYTAARRRASNTRVLIYVDTLEYLKRGGHVGSTAAFMGSKLSIHPLLTVNDGQVEPVEKVMGTERALTRLVDHAIHLASGRQVDVAVEHFDAHERASGLLAQLQRRIPYGREFVLSQVSAAIGTNVGPGALAVTVSPV